MGGVAVAAGLFASIPESSQPCPTEIGRRVVSSKRKNWTPRDQERTHGEPGNLGHGPRPTTTIASMGSQNQNPTSCTCTLQIYIAHSCMLKKIDPRARLTSIGWSAVFVSFLGFEMYLFIYLFAIYTST
jgi:hypothetical protein